MGDHTDTLTTIKDKPHSHEYLISRSPVRKGKLYFNDIMQLRDQLKALYGWGLAIDENKKLEVKDEKTP